MKTEEKSVFYQIVDTEGTPVNKFIYTNLEFAEGYCDHLMRNYKEWHGVRELTLRNY